MHTHGLTEQNLLIDRMRSQLSENGFTELTSPEAVDEALTDLTGTTLLVINSVCGCAAGSARPGIVLSLRGAGDRPERLLTVFAGQDREATARAREYLGNLPPSSPAAYLLRDGEVVYALHRHDIEGHEAPQIAGTLQAAYARYC